MNPALQKIADYMSGHRERSAIDPIDMGAASLPHIFILEVQAGTADIPSRLHIRLAGTALDRAFGRSVTGAHLDDFLHGSHSAEVLDGFRRCANQHQALWMRQVVQIAGKLPRYVEGIAFYVEPALIYGGLVFGEVSVDSSDASFECRCLDAD